MDLSREASRFLRLCSSELEGDFLQGLCSSSFEHKGDTNFFRPPARSPKLCIKPGPKHLGAGKKIPNIFH